MKCRMLILKANCGLTAYIYEDEVLSEVHPFSDESKVGNIYVATVENIVNNLDAAFLRIDDGDMLYYSLKENENKHIFLKNGRSGKVKKGDQLLVQVVKETTGNKKSQATAELAIRGKMTVANYSGKIGISKKIKNENKRNELKEIFENFKKDNPELFNGNEGAIFRSLSAYMDEKVITEDLKLTLETLQEVRNSATFSIPGKCIYSHDEKFIDYIIEKIGKSNYDEVCIITDEKVVYDELLLVYKNAELNDEKTDNKIKVMMHQDTMQSLRALYNLDKELSVNFGHKIYLHSGGYLIVDPTEALTVIDVNTGKDIKGSSVSNHFKKTNIEAVKAISRLMRIRNLSGIMIVDLINMKNDEDLTEVIKVLKEYISRDSNKCFFVDMTGLGLAEITRQKIRIPYNLKDLLFDGH
ncbi:ribonuclease E/G [Eubacterium ruminantium]|uniref:ribonuclease E/G n=1 Tax=Eubacterium ruminantium TaxID=42322 RepID=UPI001569244B|nr:ribonuclease E/G [Eubacterium ruminantium]